MYTRNRQQMGFHGRYKFYHSLGTAPGFISVELRLFYYYLYANSFMQLSVFFAMAKEIRQRELSNCRIKDGVLLNFLLLLVDYLPMAAFVGTDTTDFLGHFLNIPLNSFYGDT